jgi:hypothetical protein
MAFPARQMIFDIIGDLLADRRQRKQFGFNERVVGLLDKFPTHGRLIPQIGKPFIYAEHSCGCRKLNPAILVMQSAQDWATKNVPGAIDGTRDRCIFLEG